MTKIPAMRKYKIYGKYSIELEANNKRDAEIYAQQLITIDRKHYSIKHLKPTFTFSRVKTVIGKITKYKMG